GGSPVRECRTPGSVRGMRSNAHPYRDKGEAAKCDSPRPPIARQGEDEGLEPAASLRQRLRAVALAVEVGDEVGALLLVLDAGEGHLGAGCGLLRPVEPFVELVEAPVAADLLDRVRILEARTARHLVADDAVEVGADARGLALAER